MKPTTNPLSIGLLSGLSLVAGTGATGTASAATISDSAPFSTSDTLMLTDADFSPPGPETDTAVSGDMNQLNQFDPSLGTLTGVTFNLTSALGETGLSLTVFEQEQGSNGSASADFTLELDDSVTGNLFNNMFNHTASCSDGSGGCMDSDTSSSGASYDDTVNAAVLGGYMGLGSFDVFVNQVIDLSVETFPGSGGESGDAEATFDGSWSGDVEVVYTFDEAVVPIPAAAWLFGSGMLGLIGVARRKR